MKDYLSISELSTLKADLIIIKIPKDEKKVSAIIEMPNYDAWLDDFDIMLIVEALCKGLDTEQRMNLGMNLINDKVTVVT